MDGCTDVRVDDWSVRYDDGRRWIRKRYGFDYSKNLQTLNIKNVNLIRALSNRLDHISQRDIVLVINRDNAYLGILIEGGHKVRSQTNPVHHLLQKPNVTIKAVHIRSTVIRTASLAVALCFYISLRFHPSGKISLPLSGNELEIISQGIGMG